jgi:hypothetical protein
MSPPHDAHDDTHGDEADRTVEFDAPTDGTTDTDTDGRPHREDASETGQRAGRETGTGVADGTERAGTTSEGIRRALDGVLPEAGVDSRWWYCVAAVGGAIGAGLFVFAGLLDLAGFGGLASFSTFVLFGGVAALFGLVGVVVAVLFPVGMYVDARAIEALDGEWTPDPVLWGLLAVVAVLVTNFVLSVPLALYYLYRRHEALGTP